MTPSHEPASGMEPADVDDALASVANVEGDAVAAEADDPPRSDDGDERDPEEVLALDPSIAGAGLGERDGAEAAIGGDGEAPRPRGA